jgi:hypothetical protein
MDRADEIKEADTDKKVIEVEGADKGEDQDEAMI